MNNKVLLILVDGMKGDSVLNCVHPFAVKARAKFTNKLNAKTVMPSCTLPCHMSLFHSAPPQRHGVLSNTYIPQVRPIKSMINLFKENDKNCAMFYNWEELRDSYKPGGMEYTLYKCCEIDGSSDEYLTNSCIDYLKEKKTDFCFLYLGCPDVVGHDYGWESDEFTNAILQAFSNIQNAYEKLKDDYTIIITADHGGHDRTHGFDCYEDMTIPVIIIGDKFTSNINLPDDTNIIDLAPTIAKIIGVKSDKDWEGKALID